MVEIFDIKTAEKNMSGRGGKNSQPQSTCQPHFAEKWLKVYSGKKGSKGWLFPPVVSRFSPKKSQNHPKSFPDLSRENPPKIAFRFPFPVFPGPSGVPRIAKYGVKNTLHVTLQKKHLSNLFVPTVTTAQCSRFDFLMTKFFKLRTLQKFQQFRKKFEWLNLQNLQKAARKRYENDF